MLQRSLHSTLGCFPTTAGSVQFCLLCCQPEPVPESLPARPHSLTRTCPCRLPVWLGQPIHMACRTCSTPQCSVSYTPIWGTERNDSLQTKVCRKNPQRCCCHELAEHSTHSTEVPGSDPGTAAAARATTKQGKPTGRQCRAQKMTPEAAAARTPAATQAPVTCFLWIFNRLLSDHMDFRSSHKQN